MSFELLLLAGLGAAIVCFLKGRPLRGLSATALVAGGATAAFSFESALTTMFLMPVVVIAGLVLAWAPAEPGSYWDRRLATGTTGERLIDTEAGSRRSGRAAVGAIIGLLPGVLLVVGVFVVDSIVGLTGDQTQIAFLAIPLGFFGMIAGAIIGHGWVPRRKAQRERERVRS